MRKEHIDLMYKQSHEKAGALIVTQPMPLKVTGFVMTLRGEKIVSVNSKLPRAERSAIVNDLLKGKGQTLSGTVRS